MLRKLKSDLFTRPRMARMARIMHHQSPKVDLITIQATDLKFSFNPNWNLHVIHNYGGSEPFSLTKGIHNLQCIIHHTNKGQSANKSYDNSKWMSILIEMQWTGRLSTHSWSKLNLHIDFVKTHSLIIWYMYCHRVWKILKHNWLIK